MDINPQTDNKSFVNETRLTNLVKLTKTTMSFLLHQVDEGTLKQFASNEQIIEFEKQIEAVLINKIKNKFGI